MPSLYSFQKMPIALINPEQMGKLPTLEYRVETPYKNGPLDHLFQTADEAIAEADKRAPKYGSAYVIDLETEKVIHFSFCREPLEANKYNHQPKLHDWASGYSWTYVEKDGTIRRG